MDPDPRHRLLYVIAHFTAQVNKCGVLFSSLTHNRMMASVRQHHEAVHGFPPFDPEVDLLVLSDGPPPPQPQDETREEEEDQQFVDGGDAQLSDGDAQLSDGDAQLSDKDAQDSVSGQNEGIFPCVPGTSEQTGAKGNLSL